MLGTSTATNNNNLSMGFPSLNGSLGSNISGSLTSLPTGNPTDSMFEYSGGGGLGSLSSSTGNISQLMDNNAMFGRVPSPVVVGGGMQSPYGTSPNTATSSYLNTEDFHQAMSPMDLHDDMSMDLDIPAHVLRETSHLNWLDLDMDTSTTQSTLANTDNNVPTSGDTSIYGARSPSGMASPSLGLSNGIGSRDYGMKELNPSSLFSSQNGGVGLNDINPTMLGSNSLFGHGGGGTKGATGTGYLGGSRGLQEGCISLFDLENGDY